MQRNLPKWSRVVEAACLVLAERGYEGAVLRRVGIGRYEVALDDGLTVAITGLTDDLGLGFWALGACPFDYTDAATGEELAEAVLHHISRRAS